LFTDLSTENGDRQFACRRQRFTRRV